MHPYNAELDTRGAGKVRAGRMSFCTMALHRFHHMRVREVRPMPVAYSPSRSLAMAAGSIAVILGFVLGLNLWIIIPGVLIIAWGAFC